MNQNIVLRVVSRFIIPFILLYAFYVQFHGEVSPGGGFQAGVIFAAAFILHALVFGLKKTQTVISIERLRILACLGTLIYAGTGVATILLGGHFLEYSELAGSDVAGQKIGIFVIELGVGITVFSIILLLFYLFAGRKKP